MDKCYFETKDLFTSRQYTYYFEGITNEGNSIGAPRTPWNSSTKLLLREKVWFSYIDKQVEELCKSCIPCLASILKNESEPLKMPELPDDPRVELSGDFYGP